ncbi:MAG: ParA family protein [Desulfohalobiaceae bacterium]
MPNTSIQTIAVANQKGGVGKTTTTLTLGAALSKLGYRTLVLDLDPHACATIHLAYYPEQISSCPLQAFALEQAGQSPLDWDSLIHKDSRHYFDFVPGSIKLSELEADLKDKKGKGVALRKNLELVKRDYDYILLDCPPHLGVILINALVAADLTIIPIQTEFLALHGLRLTFDTIRMLNRALPEQIYYKTLATMHDRRVGACRRVYNLLRKKLGDRFFQTAINIDTQFREASAQGKLIFDVAPRSRGGAEYLRLAREIERL